MKRRDFLKQSSVAAIGAFFLTPFSTRANIFKEQHRNKKAKNIIFMVSDGMSSGTLAMADIYLKRTYNRSSNWISLYENQMVQRSLMNMASANSIVTDSAAASSSWGGGFLVNNGNLNVSPDGKENTPILQKFKKAGKKVGCVTTVPITHATPAGFCVSIKRRNSMSEIAQIYAGLGFDVMMGGGNKYFDASFRKDKKDLYSVFKNNGYTVAKTKDEMLLSPKDKPLLGVFDEEGLPYTVDHIRNEKALKTIPSLAEMTAKAIEQMKDHPEGFVMQVEGGKVDWAAHGNDLPALIFDQIAFDDAIKVAIDFAKKDENTLVVVTSDHGNANPGLIYGKNCNDNFDKLREFTQSNELLLQGIKPKDSIKNIKDNIAESCGGMLISDEQARSIKSYYGNSKREEDGLYNIKHLPFKLLADIQKSHTSVGWISMDHSSDYVELAMFGPGSENLKPFIRNTEMHNFLLKATEVDMLTK